MAEIIQEEVPHPLTVDGWLTGDEQEFSMVHSSVIANITRASHAIRAISRLVHNSIEEPDATGAQTLGRGTEGDLLSALICLGEYIFEKTECMRETAAMHANFEREQGEQHG